MSGLFLCLDAESFHPAMRVCLAKNLARNTINHGRPPLAVYASQSEAEHDRMLRRANKRRMRLGGEPGTYSLIRRPKGMWRRTYKRELEAIFDDEELADEMFVIHAARLLDRLNPNWRKR